MQNKLIYILILMFFFSCDTQLKEEEQQSVERYDVAMNLAVSAGSEAELQHHYTFDNESDLIKDETGNHHALLSTSEFVSEGKIGGAVTSANKGYVRLSNPRQRVGAFHDSFSARSYSIWFKASNTSRNQYLIEEGGRINSMGLRIKNNKLHAGVTTRGQRNRVIIKTPFTDTESWHHAAVVFDNGEFSLYLDGELIKTKHACFTRVRKHPNGAAIGAMNGRSVFMKRKKRQKVRNFFQGLIDDVKVFNGALSAEMVSELNNTDTGSEGLKLSFTTSKYDVRTRVLTDAHLELKLNDQIVFNDETPSDTTHFDLDKPVDGIYTFKVTKWGFFTVERSYTADQLEALANGSLNIDLTEHIMTFKHSISTPAGSTAHLKVYIDGVLDLDVSNAASNVTFTKLHDIAGATYRVHATNDLGAEYNTTYTYEEMQMFSNNPVVINLTGGSSPR